MIWLVATAVMAWRRCRREADSYGLSVGERDVRILRGTSKAKSKAKFVEEVGWSKKASTRPLQDGICKTHQTRSNHLLVVATRHAGVQRGVGNLPRLPPELAEGEVAHHPGGAPV